MLINLTNHPSKAWQKKQFAALAPYGKVVDMPFPQVKPEASIEEVRDVAKEYLARIEELNPDAVYLAGEFTFTFMVADELLRRGVCVCIGTSVRNPVEEKLDDDTIKKTLTYDFVMIRKYARLCE